MMELHRDGYRVSSGLNRKTVVVKTVVKSQEMGETLLGIYLDITTVPEFLPVLATVPSGGEK